MNFEIANTISFISIPCDFCDM